MLGQESGSSESKRLKRDGGEDIEDRISALPDAILTHLLSFLRTKEAVRTSVLSKRWESAWSFVSKLEFDDVLDMDRDDKWNAQSFDEYVDGVLSLHDCLFIEKFTLKCGPNYHSLLIYKWISAATIRHVEELHITVHGSHLGPLPLCIYTCERLEVLKVKGYFALQVPALVCLNKLQVLWLEGIEILDGSSFEKLLYSTPMLDELHLSSFLWHHVKTLSICSPTLKRLFLQDNLHCVNAINKRIVVDSPSLISIGLFCGVVSLRSSLSLVSAANIGIYTSSPRGYDFELLESISSIVRLRMCGFSEDFFLDNDLETQLPIFPNLKHLEVEVKNGAYQFVPYLIQKCPNLAHLSMVMHTLHTKDDDSDPFFRLPSGLEEIMIRDFQGREFEVEAIGFLLGKPSVLKKVTIFLADRASGRQLEKAILKLLKFPRCSTTCEIAFPSLSTSTRSEFWF